MTIIIGIVASRGVKTTRDFAIGNKDFMTLTLIMTIFATYVDSEIVLNGATKALKRVLVSFVLIAQIF